MSNRIEAIYLVSDDGIGLRAGHDAALSHTVRQSDTYHAVAHTLGNWVDRFEKSAYKAIKEEYEREQKVESAKSEQAKRHRKLGGHSRIYFIILILPKALLRTVKR